MTHLDGSSASLPAALAARAGATPHDPWLFFAEGWRWRWRSFRALDGWVGRWAAALAGHPPGTRLRFPYRPSPQGIALDLAAQAAGLIAQPVAAPLATGAPWRVEALGPDGAPAVEVWLPPEPGEGPAEQSRAPRAGGVMVEEEDDGPREVSQAELEEWAARIEAEVWAAKGRPGSGAARFEAEGAAREGDGVAAGRGSAAHAASRRREVVVSCRPLAEPAERALLAWATLAGAAVVLEPDPASLVATAAWARPTLVAGAAAEIVALRRVVGRGRRRGRRLPLGRLRLLLVTGREPLDPAEAALWRERGVRVAAAGASASK